MRSLPLLFASLMTLWQVAMGPVPAQAGTEADMAPPPGLTDYLQEKMRKRRIPGMQVAVVRGDRIVFAGAYGKANLQNDVPVTPESVFSLNSATKSFTGVAILQLADAGRLQLDAPVSRYLEGLPAPWQAVTIRQLLSHTSGLPDILVPPTRQGTGSLVGDGSEEDAWRTVQTLPMDFPTGSAYRYNQTNYALLGRIIDKLGGVPFTRFIAERQFAVAGMKTAGFGDSRDVITQRAQPYRYAQGSTTRADGALEHAFDEFPAMLRTGAGINASAEDVARWIIALKQGRLIRRDSLATLWTPGRFNDGRLAPWASGWPVIAREEHPAVAGIGGRRSAFYVYPQDDLAVVVLTNLAGANPEEFIDEIAGFYLPALSAANGGGLPRAIKLLRRELMARGFEHAVGVAAELSRKDPAFALKEDDLNVWGYRLMQEDQKQEAIEVLKLNAALHPSSGNAYDSLAEAFEVAGDRDAAIRHYRRSLELDPRNRNAVEHLKKLEAPAASRQ